MALRHASDIPLDELVRRADLAMYRAKRERAGAVRFYSPEFDGRAPTSVEDTQRALLVARLN